MGSFGGPFFWVMADLRGKIYPLEKAVILRAVAGSIPAKPFIAYAGRDARKSPVRVDPATARRMTGVAAGPSCQGPTMVSVGQRARYDAALAAKRSRWGTSGFIASSPR